MGMKTNEKEGYCVFPEILTRKSTGHAWHNRAMKKPQQIFFFPAFFASWQDQPSSS